MSKYAYPIGSDRQKAQTSQVALPTEKLFGRLIGWEVQKITSVNIKR